MKANRTVALLLFGLWWLCATPGVGRDRPKVDRGRYREWKAYAGGPDSIRYSALDQIKRKNVHKLDVAWTYDTGDAFAESEMQCNPIVVDGVLYATSPKLRVFALNAATGKLIWSFDPFDGKKVSGKTRNRGVTWWGDAKDQRIFAAAGHFLYSLDARTGHPVPGFGEDGRVDLRRGFERDPKSLSIGASTPGIIYKDLLILGSIVSEALPATPGDIRAYDVRTGAMRWSFHTIPHPGELGYDTWTKDAWTYIGGANNWTGMALDAARGLVFVPTGSAAFDFYGANRLGDNLFANSLLALKAGTGERLWHFQAVKHDVWDRDFPAPPALITVLRDGKPVDAVAQTTKSGHVYVFERETGRPLFPIEYRETAPSPIEGETLAATQPLPVRPAPFARQQLTAAMLTQRTPEAHAAALEVFRKLRSGPAFTPPSAEGTIIFPGFDGGAEWGGPGFDPETGLLYVNSNEMAWVLRLVEKKKAKGPVNGQDLYADQCAACHRADLKGTPPEFPGLVDIGNKYNEDEMRKLIVEGRGRMPALANLNGLAARAISRFLLFGEKEQVSGLPDTPSPIDLKYTIDGYNKFLDIDGYPAIAPPWGTLNAISLDSGEIVWQIPFGEFPELAAKGLRNTGTENYGGPVVTAGGLVFIGATNHDRKFHAYDKATGELLWETTLPAGGNATPATYMVNGRQYVVIACGGGKSGAPTGGSYVAFALGKGKRK